MAEEKEAFLDRWSRLKKEQAAEKAAPPPVEKKEELPPALPPVEQLTPESDFKPFMDPRVDLETRRSALKKLFADAHFNVPDPFEAYSEDYTGGEPIPPEMLKTLQHAKKLLFDDEKETLAQAAAEKPAAETAAGKPDDVPGKQDA